MQRREFLQTAAAVAGAAAGDVPDTGITIEQNRPLELADRDDDERGTSSRCSRCGYEDAGDRVERGLWACSRCGLVRNADVNGRTISDNSH